jgi:hypothetical protein
LFWFTKYFLEKKTACGWSTLWWQF